MNLPEPSNISQLQFPNMPNDRLSGGVMPQFPERRDMDPLNPRPLDHPRTNYRQAEGQQVMGFPDLSETHELDLHGNVYKKMDQGFYGKYTSKSREWDKTPTTQVNTNSIFDTGQKAEDTGPHDYIKGKMKENNPAYIVLKDGKPTIADGHHRIAEYRGRGIETMPVKIRNADEEEAVKPTLPSVGTGDMAQHLEEHHPVWEDLAQHDSNWHAVAHIHFEAEHNHTHLGPQWNPRPGGLVM
jgi:hypothetical protein